MVTWREFVEVGVLVAIASFVGMAVFGSRGLCGNPNIPYVLGMLAGLGLVGIGLFIAAIDWVWRRD